MSTEHKCRHCGHCCIVCTDIQLTKEEVAEGRYKMIKRRARTRLNGWSNMILARKEIFSDELGRPVFCCFYFDQHAKECSIYEDRPTVCRMFDCIERAEKTKLKIHKAWHEIRMGDDGYYCLEG